MYCLQSYFCVSFLANHDKYTIRLTL